jgi:16S rRNA (uracil1498-N3)-methyltransferase
MARHVPHVYVPAPWGDLQIQLGEQATNHLEKVLRRTDVSAISYTDGAGLVGSGIYASGWIERGEEHHLPAPDRAVTVAVAPPKSTNRLRFVVEKLAELGTTRLIWLETAHTEGRPPRPEKSLAWAEAALQQSKGAWLMHTGRVMTINDVGQFGTVVVADQDGIGAGELESIGDVVLCIGPEGGFAPAEIPTDAARLKLSERVLRIETAAVAGAALLINMPLHR